MADMQKRFLELERVAQNVRGPEIEPWKGIETRISSSMFGGFALYAREHWNYSKTYPFEYVEGVTTVRAFIEQTI